MPLIDQVSQDMVSPQNDNVLFAQSRNVLLTGSGWGGGNRYTSHDPTGPRSADRPEKSQEGADHPASSRRRNRADRTACPAVAGKAEARGRPGGHSRAAGKTIQPQTGREEPGESGGDSRAREVSRVRPHAGQRVPRPASSDHSQSRNGESMDDPSPAMAVPETAGGESSRVAPEAGPLRRVGVVGHQRAPVAGRAWAEALPDQHDRRRHQPAACAFCAPRLDRGKHAFAVELFGMLWASTQLLYRQGEPVSNRGQDPAGSQRTAPRRTRTTAAHADWTGAGGSGYRLDRSALAAGQGTGGTKFSNGAGPSGERLAGGGSADSGASQCLPGIRVHSLVEPDPNGGAGRGGRSTTPASQGPLAAGFVELCRKPRSGQWVHHPVRPQDLPDRPRGYSCWPARSSGADRTSAGRIHGGSLPRPLPGGERMCGAPQSGGACQETQDQETGLRPATENSVDEEFPFHQSRQGRSFCDPSRSHPQRKTHSVGRARAARPASRFLYSKPPFGSLTKVIWPTKAKPPEGTPQGPVNRGFAAVYFGANSVASALNLPRERDLPKNHPHSTPHLSNPTPKQDISTLQRIGHFYFALTASIQTRTVHAWWGIITSAAAASCSAARPAPRSA